MGGSVVKKTPNLTVKAYLGDVKTLLAFDVPEAKSTNLVGFTIACQPGTQPPYYLHNTLVFETAGKHAQDPKEPANSSINAPFQKFRWLHVPGIVHQGLEPFFGDYTYSVTPRYVDGQGSMLPLDATLSVSMVVPVKPFDLNGLKLGFTRGYTQSQAFVNHFGLKALIRPVGKELLFDTTQLSGSDAQGVQYTYDQEYAWLGFTARARIMELLNGVYSDGSLSVDVFAYDLNEPEIISSLLALADVGRVRIILDNAALHHDSSGSTPEDQFEQLFIKAQKNGAAIKRGHFQRYSHDKVFIVRSSSDQTAIKVLTGSTNFSVTGMYVNSNHVLVFGVPKVAAKYAEVFDTVWAGDVKEASFLTSNLSSDTFKFNLSPKIGGEITFSPHSLDDTNAILGTVAARINLEGTKTNQVGSVLFAVMEMDSGQSPVYTALKTLHENQSIFSYGISDNPGGIALYSPGKPNGILVTGKPVATQLPEPFNQVRNIGGVGHQIHHKFVVCGFNGDDPTVYCGSSNLALGGEQANGDNLLCIRSEEVATAFALEAIGLVDHFRFLNKFATQSKKSVNAQAPALKSQAAVSAKWFLWTNDSWTKGYFNPVDLKCVDRKLFGG